LQKKESLIKKWHKLNNKALKLLEAHEAYNSLKEYEETILKMDDIEETLWNEYQFNMNSFMGEEIWSEEIQETFK
jgi:hypothetical protein